MTEMLDPETLVALNELYGDGLLDPPGRGIVPGGSFLFDIPAGVPALWGKGGTVAWAEGEPLMIAGPQGVGKTSDLGQLAFGLCGVPGFETLYDLPVRPVPDGKTVLYLALDRPRQIARALRRMVTAENRDLLDARLVVHQGMLPFVLAQEPGALAAWASEYYAGAVLIDSLKDVAGKLSDEEVGAALNAAFQTCIAEGIEVAIAHHNRKSNADNRRPKTLDDVHGSGNLTRGLGSVVCLYGAAGDSEIELTHLKQPAEPIGPFVIERDHESGRSRVSEYGLLERGKKAERVIAVRNHFVNNGGPGTTFTLKELVEARLGSANTVREALATIVGQGWLTRNDPGVGGRGHEVSWTYVAPLAGRAV